MKDNAKKGLRRLQTLFMETFGLGAGVSWIASVLTVLVVVAAFFWFFYSAPPRTITITAGPEGSSFEIMAKQYGDQLRKKGITLRILTSGGSDENLARLEDKSSKVDIGFVQCGMTNGTEAGKLVSLGTVVIQPLLIFYRGSEPVQILSQLSGKRLAIGSPGSGVRTLALELLETNGVTSKSAAFVDLEPAEAAQALTNGTVDAIFLMGDTASPQTMKAVLHNSNVHLYDVTQADGYVRRLTYLTKLDLPRGAIDFGRDIPDHDVALVGPAVELLARPSLHPALSDLLLESAHTVNGKPGIFRHLNEYPANVEHDIPLSASAVRYYKSGKGFFYSFLPFWLASLISRVLVAFVPMLVILIPGLRLIPAMLRWRIRIRILHRYRTLLALEKEVRLNHATGPRDQWLARLDQIESGVNNMKVPASFADQFYGLRGHISFVRDQILQARQSA